MVKKIFCILLTLFLVASFSSCSMTQFDGSRTGNESQFIMEYRMLNTTDFQLLSLTEGDVIDVQVASDSGKVNIEVKKEEDDNTIYRGNDVPTSSFQLTIQESGIYMVTVKGEKAKGSVSFIKGSE